MIGSNDLEHIKIILKSDKIKCSKCSPFFPNSRIQEHSVVASKLTAQNLSKAHIQNKNITYLTTLIVKASGLPTYYKVTSLKSRNVNKTFQKGGERSESH